MILLCYIALTFVAASMAMDDGRGICPDPFRTSLTGFIGSMSATTVPIMIGTYSSIQWANAAFYLIAAASTLVIGLYAASPIIVARSIRRRDAERARQDAEEQRLREMDPVVFATKWVPELANATTEAVASIDRFMERTADTYDDSAIDARVLAGHVPEIVRLAGEAMAKQDDSFRAFTARSAIDRVIAIGRAIDKAAMQLRTPEDEALEARLRYVDVQVDDRFSAIA